MGGQYNQLIVTLIMAGSLVTSEPAKILGTVQFALPSIAFLSHFPAEARAAAWMLLFADDLIIFQHLTPRLSTKDCSPCTGDLSHQLERCHQTIQRITFFHP
jgi:hypothetical protein